MNSRRSKSGYAKLALRAEHRREPLSDPNAGRRGRRIADAHFAAAENKVHVHDLHATLLHQLGFDHAKLTYRYAGRDFRLTDVAGTIVTDLLA